MTKFGLGITAVLIAGSLVAGCSSGADDGAQGDSGPQAIGEFSAIRVADGFQVVVERGSSSTVDLEVSGVSADQIEASVSDGTLELRTKDGAVPLGASLAATVVAPAINGVTATSGSSVSLQRGLTLGDPEAMIDLTAGASFSGDVSAKSLEIQMQAGATAGVTGSARRVNLIGAEAATLSGKALSVSEATVNLSSAATAELTVNWLLEVTLASGASFTYSGSPKITKRSVDSSATLNSDAEG